MVMNDAQCSIMWRKFPDETPEDGRLYMIVANDEVYAMCYDAQEQAFAMKPPIGAGRFMIHMSHVTHFAEIPMPEDTVRNVSDEQIDATLDKHQWLLDGLEKRGD